MGLITTGIWGDLSIRYVLEPLCQTLLETLCMHLCTENHVLLEFLLLCSPEAEERVFQQSGQQLARTQGPVVQDNTA